MATYLVHCPAHLVVGTTVGVRFRELRFGRTTLAGAHPNRLKGPACLLPVLTLTNRSSLVKVSRRGLAAMYASGTVVSTAPAFAIAAASTLAERPTYILLTWAVAMAHFAFDVVFSPKGGDLKRARAVLAAWLRESSRLQERNVECELPVSGEIRRDFTQDACELEPMARTGAYDNDPRVGWMGSYCEVQVRCVRVYASG